MAADLPVFQRVTAASVGEHANLEVRDAWAVERVEDGLWLHAGPGSRTGLCVQLAITPGAPFHVTADLELAHLEPALPLSVVYKDGSQYASAAIVPRWVDHGGPLVLEHGLTLLDGRTGGSAEVASRALPEGTVHLRLRVTYLPAPPRLLASTDGDLLPPVELLLGEALPGGGPAYVSLWLQEGEVHRPPGPVSGDVPEYSKVLVKELTVRAPPGAASPTAQSWPGAELGWVGRRSLVEPVDTLLADLRGTKEGALGAHLGDVLFLGALRASADPTPARTLELLRRSGVSPGGRARRPAQVWEARRGALLAFDDAERRALLAWAIGVPLDRGLDDPVAYGLRVVGPNLGEEDDEPRPQHDPDWWLAALCLTTAARPEVHPVEAGRALTMIGDFDRALALLREAMTDARRPEVERAAARVYAGYAAYRARRFGEAADLWRDQPLQNPRRRRIREGLEHHLR